MADAGGGKASSTRADASTVPVRNAILRSLPTSEYEHLRSFLEPVKLPSQTILHEATRKIEYAYFLNDGMVSLVVLTQDGKSVEVAIVGNEGIVGTSLAVGMEWSPHRAVMQIGGAGVRMKAGALVDLWPSVPELRLQWNRFALLQGLQVAQIAACNRLHDIEQRLARWLLMCQDRINSERMEVTHEFLAQMLGTGRPGVTLAAGILQRRGLIENLRGALRIVDRAGLEKASCECYSAMQRFKVLRP